MEKRPEKSTVFEETFLNYMAQIREIPLTRFPKIGALLGVDVREDAFMIPFFDGLYALSHSGIVDMKAPTRPVPFGVRVAILKYVLMCPETEPPPESAWVTYKDFKDAAPLIHYFTTRVDLVIANAFSGKVAMLERAVKTLGGVPSPMFKESYDLSMMLHTFPRIPTLINFNDQDDEFPAACSILYQKASASFLDMESLAITAAYCAAKLIAFTENGIL